MDSLSSFRVYHINNYRPRRRPNNAGLLKRLRFAVLLGAILPLAAEPAPIASPFATINAHVVKLRNNSGQIICTLFTPSDKFPEKSRRGRTIAVAIQDKQATCRFKNVPYGDYAIVVFHDENNDREFNQNWLGMPKEGFGFSNNPGTLKKPVFADAHFNVDQPIVDVTIRLNYWF